MSRIRRIVHASDFSKASRPAFAKALELAKANRAELIVVHALTLVLPFAGGEYVSPQTWDDLEASARSEAEKHLRTLVAKAKKAGVRAKSVIVIGSPYEQIARAARSSRADLLVIGTHGRTGLPKFFLGSVAQRILATARCPVLTVRAS